MHFCKVKLYELFNNRNLLRTLRNYTEDVTLELKTISKAMAMQ